MAIAACATPLVGAIAEKFGFEGAATRSVPESSDLRDVVARTACGVSAGLLQLSLQGDSPQQPVTFVWAMMV